MKLRIHKTYPPLADGSPSEPRTCVACAGSGWYDWVNPHTGHQPRCGACDGTGIEPQV